MTSSFLVEDLEIQKRNKQLAAVISIVIIVSAAAFLVIYEDHQSALIANEPVIYYSLSGTPIFFNTTGTQNNITVYYANSGKSVGDFDLTIKFVNATFSSTTQQSYTMINAASAKFSWDLTPGNFGSENVSFSINPNVDGFSISLSIHSNQGSLKAIAEYPYSLQYTWNVVDFQLNQ